MASALSSLFESAKAKTQLPFCSLCGIFSEGFSPSKEKRLRKETAMSIISKVSKYHGAGEDVNENNMTQYGQPARTLYTALALGDLHRKITVTDEDDRVLYWTKSSVIAIRGKTDIFDANNKLVAHLEKKIISLHEKRTITMADGQTITLSNRLLQIFKDTTDIVELGWQLKGNIIGLNFTLFDKNGEPVAVIGQKMLSIHNRYSIDIYKPEYEKIAVSIVISLQHMLEDRNEKNS